MEKLLKKIKKELQEYNPDAVLTIVKKEEMGVEYIKIEDIRPIYLPYKILRGCSIGVCNSENKTIMQIFKPNKK